MNCDEVKLELALWVGNDLDDPACIEELRRHIATCPDCRWKAKSLQSSMVVLGASDPDPTYDQAESLWPELKARIEYLEKTPKNPPPYGAWALALTCGVALCGGVWSWMHHATPSSPPPIPPPAPPSVSHSSQSQSVHSHSAHSPGDSPGNAAAPNP